MNYIRSSLFITFCFLFVTQATASKPWLSRDGQTCEEILSGLSHTPERASLANNTFVPLSVLLASNKCKMVAKNWREGPYHSKTLPTPGLLEMFRTADEASANVIEQLGLKGVESPEYNKRSPLEGAAATLSMMEREKSPKYIRNGVLFREGVFTVVPLLMKNEDGMYAPLVAKGHQDLNREDIYTAAFTAWALEPWIGQVPEKAYIHLVPMVTKRETSKPELNESTFEINPAQYFPIIREVYEDFVSTVSSPEKLEEIYPRRCTQCNRCPWAAHCRSMMKASHDLSMIPLPPTAAQVEVFKAQGYEDLSALSRLDINGKAFVDLALRSGLNSSRLRYMVAHAKAVIGGKPLRTQRYVDPFENKKVAVHIDFEDIMDPEIRSGVYLFGVETQNLGAKESKAMKKKFFFAEELSQASIDSAWASFIHFLQKDRKIEKDDWVITMYSKHEIVKFEQQFDIVKGPASVFSAAQRKSPFYSEIGDSDKPTGRLIRRKDFFDAYPDILPSEIFNVLDRSVDLLEYTRKSLAFPTYSKGIKHILPYVRTRREPLAYPEGANGLESMAWAREAYARNESAYFEMAQDYNEIDIDANRLVSDFVRANSGLPMASQLKWSAKMEKFRSDLDEAVKLKNIVVQLLARKNMIEKAAQKSLVQWKDSKLEEFRTILDRGNYLTERTQISDLPKVDAKIKDARLQKLRFEFIASRQAKLYEFLIKLNPSLKVSEKRDDAQSAFVDLLQMPASQLGPKHLQQMLLLADLQKEFSKLKLRIPENPMDRVSIPDGYMEKLERIRGLEEYAQQLELSSAEIKTLWRGLYLANAFGILGNK